ncbi:hypothetical protein NG799_26055 [Laspinema sp. D1]|uniref:Uncharacterized protein n=1 Tax=Laspinema palackyanum D2a TaxID=2953684 RepID=A0ABT2MZ22_9CYAN|nr:hypothetical protein [Laspinema sp. D2a]
MKKNFGELIYSSFIESQGVLIGFVGIFLTLISARFPFKTQIPLDMVIVIAFFMLLLVVTLSRASYQSFKTAQEASNQSFKTAQELSQLQASYKSFKTAQELSQLHNSVIPKMLYVSKETSSPAPFQLRCLLGNSALFSNDTCISFYSGSRTHEVQ